MPTLRTHAKSLLRILSLLCGSSLLASAWAAPDVIRGPGWLAISPTALGDQPYKASFTGKGWYVDAQTGQDSAPGTASRPWKTLERALQAKLAPGDALLLKCGSTWRESLSIPASFAARGDVLIGGYGDCRAGQRPWIKASDTTTESDWSPQAGTGKPAVFEKKEPGKVTQVFFKGKRLLEARYPDYKGPGREFALAQGVGQKNQLKLSPKEQKLLADKDLTGAKIHVRAVAWQVESAVVTRHDEATGILTLDHDLSAPIPDGAGFVLEGKRWMLDEPGQWLYDAGARKVYLSTPDGTPPETDEVELTKRDVGIKANGVKGLSIQYLGIAHANEAAIHLDNCPESSITGTRIQYVPQYGIRADNSANVVAKRNDIEAIGMMAISMRNSTNQRILENRITDTGLAGRAGGSNAAIIADGAGALVENNLIERTANIGIRFFTKAGTTVVGNTVINPCMRMSDCGGIYTWTSQDAAQAAGKYQAKATIERNIVVGVKSNLEGAPGRVSEQANGIYLDEMTSGVTVNNNIVSGSETGIYLHNAQFNVIKDNVVRAVANASFSAHLTRPDVDVIRGNKITHNSFMARSAASGQGEVYAFKWNHSRDPEAFFKGTNPNFVDNNSVVSTSGSNTKWMMAGRFQKSSAAAREWRQYAPTDKIKDNLPLAADKAESASGPSLITDGNFQAASSPWVPYLNPAGQGGSVKIGRFKGVCAEACLRFQAGHPGDLISSKPFQMNNTPGQNRYLLTFTAVGGKGGGLSRAVVRRAGPPYEAFGLDQTATPLEEGQKQVISVVFEASSDDTARLDFSSKVHGETYISNVSLRSLASGSEASADKRSKDVVNLRDQPVVLSCADVGLGSCDLIDDTGQAVSWPLTIPGRQSIQLLVHAVKAEAKRRPAHPR